MNRNLKVLGLALVAALAMSALAASAAPAAHTAFITAGSAGAPAHIDGKQIGQQVFNRTGREVTCEIANFGESSTVPGSATSLTLKPEYKNCHAKVLGNTLPATVTMNGCDYNFTLTKDTSPTKYTVGITHIECTTPNEIQVHVYTSHENHTNNVNACTYNIPEQTITGGIELTNIAGGGGTADDVEAHIDITGQIDSVRTAGTTLLCGAVNDAAGSLTGKATLWATNAGGAHINGTVSG